MAQLAGRVAIVTGAAGNLGRAVTDALLAHGARVAQVDRDAAALRAVSPASDRTATFVADLLDSDSVAQMAADVKDRFGRVDILANIAGGFAMGPPLYETADAAWEQMLNLNARSVFYCCRAVIPLLLAAGGGRIVNISARAAREGQPRMAPYCAAKAAVITLTESLAAEHKDDRITVNCILPGTIDTPQNRSAMPDQEFDRWVSPAALAEVIVFLVSDAASCVTGAAIPVYGRS